jgi:hypothetical protein
VAANLWTGVMMHLTYRGLSLPRRRCPYTSRSGVLGSAWSLQEGLVDWIKGFGEPGGTRTHGPKIKSLVLYQLSYGLTPAR